MPNFALVIGRKGNVSKVQVIRNHFLLLSRCPNFLAVVKLVYLLRDAKDATWGFSLVWFVQQMKYFYTTNVGKI